VPVPSVFAVAGVVRHYAWGSRTAIPQLLGVEPDGEPAAELWFGAHSDDPSPAPDHGSTLDAMIAAEPQQLLGAATVSRFGPRLPFLLKVLAVDKALSIQVHPTLSQARAGFAADDVAGVARDAPERNYRDANHKPELICALTPFEALCGFRPVADTVRLLDSWDVPELAPVRDLLGGPDGLRAAFTHLITRPDPTRLVQAVAARAATVADDDEWAGPARAVRLAAGDFPGDVGAALVVLLNYVWLEPGQAIFLAAGNVHCYLRGMGVEIMANSDNVLRCGLTPKHIDVDELLKITDFSPLAEPRWPADAEGAGQTFRVPVADFALSRMDLTAAAGPYELARDTPQIVLCTAGAGSVAAAAGRAELTPGHAAFVAATAGAVAVHGAGRVFVAKLGASD
jgi:mannose-6-phosphate isomerase